MVKIHATQFLLIASALTPLLTACNTAPTTATADTHLRATARTSPSEIPDIVTQTYPTLPSAPDRLRPPTFSVAVDDVPAKELLQALARDAEMDIDFMGSIQGRVSLSAKQQTLPQIFKRIARLANLRIEIGDDHITVQPDTPVLRLYPLDYVNIQRQMSATVATSTQIAGNAGSTASNSTQGNSGGQGDGNLRIDNRSKNHFWEALEKNIRDLLRENDKDLPDGSSETLIEQESTQTGLATGITAHNGARTKPGGARLQTTNTLTPYANQHSGNTVIRKNTFQEAASVILNPESGLLSVRATQRQHERIQEFLDRVLGAARRQVLIEATIVEVELNEGYKHGIDWSRVRADGSGFSVTRPANGTLNDASGSAFSLVFKQLASPLNLVAAVDLLQAFGTTKVLSSPRLSVLNNQTALLKVVENITYFSVKSDTTVSANVGTTTAVTTTPQSVSVGLVMSVTPQISESGSVMLNIRPTISSVSDWKQDPNPTNVVANFVPQIRTREIESVMRVEHGDIAVLGGLMEDHASYQTSRLPLLGNIPLAGELLTKRDNASRKSELLIFLRPTVVRSPALTGEYSGYQPLLPRQDFFKAPAHARPLLPIESAH